MPAKKMTKERLEQQVSAAVRRAQELAVNGVAPSAKCYDLHRGTAPSTATLHRQGWTWLRWWRWRSCSGGESSD